MAIYCGSQVADPSSFRYNEDGREEIMVSSVLRIVCRHVAVLYILGTCYCVHRSKLFGSCNPLRFIKSQNGVQLKSWSLQLLAGENIDQNEMRLEKERVVYWDKDYALSAVRWVVDCGWRECVTYLYCENAGKAFFDKHPNVHWIGEGWYIERAK